ncbi:MAG TPA: DUF559 domain-containing protein [Candidatus Limiplasma sp.]|nr:DUF559 domain-containing protein [Candidatus Limiplasma sp.]
MSYFEAKEDGIPFEERPYKQTIYYPPCRFCGAPVRSWSYLRNIKYACPECRKEAVAQERAEKEQKDSSVKERKLDNAVKRISKMTDIAQYKAAIDLVRKKLNNRGWFQSTEEIMVALELARRSVNAHHQVKVFEYTVDFVLPEMKVVLEIDGAPYHGKDRQKYQQTRDDVIKWKLGDDWEVIRISTDNINTNITKLIPGIRAVLNSRKKCARQFT